mgnify:CR=1 FL=1
MNFRLAESYGTGEIRVSAAQFGEFVERVRAETGATEVDVVGYSQGAVVTRYYINKLGGAHVVDRWVGVASGLPGTGSNLPSVPLFGSSQPR